MRTPTRFSAPVVSGDGLTPFEVFEGFARKIVSVPKAEIDSEKAKANNPDKKGIGRGRKSAAKADEN